MPRLRALTYKLLQTLHDPPPKPSGKALLKRNQLQGTGAMIRPETSIASVLLQATFHEKPGAPRYRTPLAISNRRDLICLMGRWGRILHFNRGPGA